MKRLELARLEASLRDEGRKQAPAFSMPLHERIMETLAAEGLPRRVAPVVSARSLAWRIGRVAVPLAVAAGLVLAAWIVLHPIAPAPEKPIAKQRLPITVPQIMPDVALGNPLEKARYAYLDRDAQRLWTFVAEQLPMLPETGGNH